MIYKNVCMLSGAVVVAMTVGAAAQDLSKVKITSTKIADNVYTLSGSGGTMVVSVGQDGAFLVDDQFGPLSKKIQRAIAKLTKKPIRFVINTHLHADHVGGNANLAKANAVIVAHENVRTRLSKDQALKFWPLGDTTVKATPTAGLPVVTFTQSMKFRFNGQDVDVIKMPAAHTDGDSIVHFTGSNVIHAGDAVATKFPYIDVASGGTLKGFIELSEKVLSLMDGSTKVVSGHAPVLGKKEIEAFRDMLVTVQKRIGALVAKGMSEKQVLAAKPLADLDAQWGGSFVGTKLFTRTVYADMSK